MVICLNMKNKYFNYFILVLLLVFLTYKTYSRHIDSPFPYHHDEWQHLALSEQIVEEGYNKQYNPYLGIPNSFTDLESGFHLFLSSFILITNLDPILNYQYLASIFAVISGFIIFLCCYRLSKDFFVGILSLIVFISLPTNVNVLGKDFFVPFVMALPFMYMFILLYLDSLKNDKLRKFYLSVLLLFLIFIIHPPSAMILVLPVIIELFNNKKFIKKHKLFSRKKIVFLLILGLIFSILLLWTDSSEFTLYDSIEATIFYFFELLFFEPGWGKLEITYFVPYLYGLINTLFAIYGFFIVFRKKHNLSFFGVFAFISLAIIAFFNIFGFSFIIPYPRAIHYAMFAMIPLTALGLKQLLEKIKDLLNIKNKELYYFVTLFIFLLLLSFSKYDLNEKYRSYNSPVLTEKEYDALLWFEENHGQNNIVIAPYLMTSAIYPVSKNKIVGLIPAILETNNLDFREFYTSDCDEQKSFIENTNAEYLISRYTNDCDIYKLIYSDEIFIYQIK